jgi:hypothetical protein
VSEQQQPNRYADIEAIRALDFDVEPPRCIGKNCGRPATWSLTILCPARHGSIMCGPHHDVWVRNAARVAWRSAACGDCPDGPALTVPFYLWRRL